MNREEILRVLNSHPENCIRYFHRGHPFSTGRNEGWVLLRHYGGLIPDEIVLKPVMFLRVKEDVVQCDSWGNENLGGCTWKLASSLAKSS